MIRFAALGLLLAGCATQKPTEPVYLPDSQPVAIPIEPVTLKDLRGDDVLIFPDIAPKTAADRLKDHLRRCRTRDGGDRFHYDPAGFHIAGPRGERRLALMIAQVSQSSAVAIGGPDFTPAVKEELARAVQGDSRCAAA